MPIARDPRSLLRRARTRYRRPLAAGIAGLATLIALTAARTDTPPSPSPPSTEITTRAGDVRVPVPIRAGAASLQVGDLLDLVAVEGSATRQVATNALVVEGSSSGSPLGATGAVILVSVPREQALELTLAAAQSPLSVLLHSNRSAAGLDSGL